MSRILIHPGSTVHMKVQPHVLKVVQVKSSGVLVLQGRCGSTISLHQDDCAPCHLRVITDEIDPSLAVVPDRQPCVACPSSQGSKHMISEPPLSPSQHSSDLGSVRASGVGAKGVQPPLNRVCASYADVAARQGACLSYNGTRPTGCVWIEALGPHTRQRCPLPQSRGGASARGPRRPRGARVLVCARLTGGRLVALQAVRCPPRVSSSIMPRPASMVHGRAVQPYGEGSAAGRPTAAALLPSVPATSASAAAPLLATAPVATVAALCSSSSAGQQAGPVRTGAVSWPASGGAWPAAALPSHVPVTSAVLAVAAAGGVSSLATAPVAAASAAPAVLTTRTRTPEQWLRRCGV